MMSQNDQKKCLVDTTDTLKELLCIRENLHLQVLEVLNKIQKLLLPLTKINWSFDTRNLVLLVKVCIVYNDPVLCNLFLYKIEEECKPIENVCLGIVNGLSLSKKACEILALISEKMNGKENYSLLHALVEPLGTPSYRFIDLLNFCPIDGNLRISSYVSYPDIFNLLKVVIFRTKSQLANAESRNTSEQLFDSVGVSFTSLSVEMANILKELLGLGLRILSEHNFQTTTDQLGLDTVGNFTCEVASSCPFERLDPKVFENLSQYIEKFHVARPKLYSRKTFTSLCDVLMQHDPEITSNMQCLLSEKPLFRHANHVHYANSLFVDCFRSVTVWLSAVYLRSSYIVDNSLTAESELKLLSTLCKSKSFSDCLFRESTYLLGLIVSVLRTTSTLKQNLSKGYYGNLKADASIPMNVIVDAANLLCMVVKLCSQKCTEDSCSWNSEDDEGPSDSALTEFVDLWIVIIELMPELIESQVTNIPNGVLNSIAEFGESLFNLLRETPLQRMIITTVLVYCSSTLKADIRAKAGRALARLIEFNCMSENINFSMDAFDAIKLNMKAPEMSVRISFSWAFGNWSDMYLQEYLTTGGDNLSEHNHMISDFHEVICNSCEAKARVKYNIFRSAGNLLKFVSHLDEENAKKVKDIVFILIDQVGKGFDFKARWNACCALRNVFTNQCLLNCVEEDVKNRTMQCFIKHMCQSENFKERIQCVIGAASVFSRTTYGEYYMILWEKLATAASVEPPEFQSEVGQAEKLNTEVGRAYIHLMSMLLREDLERLEEIVTAKWEGIQTTIKFAVMNSPLDNFPEFELAVLNLEKLMKLSLRPFELEVCDTINRTLYNRSF